MCECGFNKERLKKELSDMGNEISTVMALQKAQGIFGYLPKEAIETIAEYLKLPVAEVYGTATFYSQFSLNKSGKYKISVCTGTACYIKGAAKILDEFKDRLGISEHQTTQDGLFSIVTARCVGCCGLAPVVTINEDVFGKFSPSGVAALIDSYKAKS